MKPYAQEAENLRLLFIAGIASVEDVVAWADQTISTLPEYDDDLTEISLGAKVPRDEMDARLRKASEGADHSEAIRNLAGRMHRILLSDRSRARDFARVLESLWIDSDYKVPEELAFMAGIDDTFSLAEVGAYGTLKDAIDDLMAETAQFDMATASPCTPSPAAASLTAKRGKGIRERLRRLLRGGQK